MKTLKAIMCFRDDKAYSATFPYKVETDSAVVAAIQSLGLKHFLHLVPANIEHEINDQPVRPYLLANILDAMKQPSISSPWIEKVILGRHSLQVFLNTLLPLADRLFKKSGLLLIENKELTAKLYETIALQIWDIFPHLCQTLPADVDSYFSKLAPILGKIIQSNPKDLFENPLPSNLDLRPLVSEGLSNLINTFQTLSELEVNIQDDQETKKFVVKSVEHAKITLNRIRTYTNRFLSALCNNYTTPDESILLNNKASQLQTLFESQIQHYERAIKSLLSIANPSDVSDYFLNMVKTVLQSQNDTVPSDLEKIRIFTVMDLCLVLMPYLPLENDVDVTSPIAMYYRILIRQLASKNSTIIKKTYKSLNFLLDSKSLKCDFGELCLLLVEPAALKALSSGATKSRMLLFKKVTNEVTPETLISFIPRVLPEVMLATKEASEKSRDAAYECLVAMGSRMIAGDSQVVKVEMEVYEDHLMDVDATEDHIASVNLKELVLMISGCLVSASSHLKSASIASLARLVFEFNQHMSVDLTSDILVSVVETMKTSPTTEIVKASLGLVKVSVVCSTITNATLPVVMDGILEHAKHKSKFRVKVRHILERLIRKHSYLTIEELVPVTERKLIANIQKRRERQKKKKNASKTPKTQESFQDVVNGTDSELGSDADDQSDDDEDCIPDEFKDGKTSKRMQIREDELVDFMDPKVISQVTNTRAKKTQKIDAGFKTNQDGLMIVQDSDEEENAKKEASPDYYKMSLASEVAFTRKADGRIKFDKKRSFDESAADPDAPKSKQWNPLAQKKAKLTPKVNNPYAAKKAQGDVNRKNMPLPHAYIPLTSSIVGKA